MDDLSPSSTPILLRYRTRTIGPAELALIRATIAAHAAAGRTRISQVLCAIWDWRQPNGALKEYACRDLLLRLVAGSRRARRQAGDPRRGRARIMSARKSLSKVKSGSPSTGEPVYLIVGRL